MQKPLLALALVVLAGVPALADDTALNVGAFGPEPVGGGLTGKESVIRMVREHLAIRVGKREATVAARFVFRNTLAHDDARQLVGFPDEGAAMQEARRRSTKAREVFAWEEGEQAGPLLGMQTLVDGRRVASRLDYAFVRLDDTAGGYGWRPSTAKDREAVLCAWHTCWVTFPAGRDVVIERRYHTAVGSDVTGQRLFQYVVATGGAWAGTIGELVADVTLADGLTTRQLSWTGSRPVVPGKPAWQLLSPTRLRLVWKDFEPRTDKRYGYMLLSFPGKKG